MTIAQTTNPYQLKKIVKLLRLANQEMLYKEKLFQQHNDVSMGSSSAPTMANFFLSSLENKLLKTQSEFHPKLYLRNVDDIFAVFNKDKKCSKFLDLLNTRHKNIKFTMEHSLETIPFVDIEIKINDTGLKHGFIESSLILIYS